MSITGEKLLKIPAYGGWTTHCWITNKSEKKSKKKSKYAYKRMKIKKKTPQNLSVQFSSFKSLSRVWLFATLWIASCQSSLSNTNSQSSLKLTSIESVMPSSHLILCRPFSSCPQSLSESESFPMSQLYAWGPKYWSFSFSISPSKEHPELIFFRMDWLDLLALQGTLKSLLQHHSSKASILWCSAFFTVQLSHPSMTTGKTIALTSNISWICGFGNLPPRPTPAHFLNQVYYSSCL